MEFILCFVLIFSTVEINGLKDENFQLFTECDRTVGSGVAACLQFFSPIKFVTDFLASNKDSLCCTHFRQNACISGVRDAVQLAKSANLCSDSITDGLITTLTDSAVNNYIRKSCQTFNAGKCVMDSVGDVVNTIQGFFTPQQQKPVIPQLFDSVPQLMSSVPKIFDRNGGNSYSNGDSYNSNHNYNSDRTSLLGPFREIINRRIVTTTENPLINKSIRDLYDRQYVAEGSDVRPTKEVLNKSTEGNTDPLRSLFSGLFNPTEQVSEEKKENPSIFESIGSLFNSNDNNNSSIEQNLSFFGNIFNANDTDSGNIVKDITDSLN